MPCATIRLDDYCGNWRIAPGGVGLAGNVIGIVCAFAWRSPFLSIPFIGGCLASSYTVYLGWQFKSLKTLEDITKDQAKQIRELTTSVNDLRGEVDRLTTENDRLNSLITEFEKLKDSLTELCDVAENNQHEFGEKLERFEDDLKLFEGIKSDSQDQLNKLATVVNWVKETFNSVKKWQDNEIVKQRQLFLALLRQQERELQSSIQQLKLEIGMLQGRTVTLNNIANKFETLLGNFNSDIVHIHEHSQELAATRKELQQLKLQIEGLRYNAISVL